VGKGLVMYGQDMREALGLLKLPPDCDRGSTDSLLFLHRVTPEEDIYFISNQSAEKRTAEPVFRVHGMVPVLWDPLSGKVRRLPAFVQQGGVTRVPLQLERYQSFFIVFRRGIKNEDTAIRRENFPVPKILMEINQPWANDQSIEGESLGINRGAGRCFRANG